jgi:hypothetical protein
MDRTQFYFKQPVAYTELNQAFDYVEDAINAFVIDYGLTGLVSGGSVAQHTPNNLTVDVVPLLAYDEAGDRMDVEVTTTVNCAVDYLAVNTAVVTSGHSKWLSLYIVFERSLSDPRTDGNGDTVYFESAESFQFNVFQGAEGTSPSRPALQASWTLLGDIEIAYAQTAIVNADISFSRTQYATNPGNPAAANVSCPATTGTTFSLAAENLAVQLAAIAAQIDGTETNGATTMLTVVNAAALRALATTPTNGVVAMATPTNGFGLYVWAASSTTADDGLYTIKPTATSGAGRWVYLDAGPLGAANGIATLTSGAKITTAQLPYGAANGITQADSTGRTPAAGVRNGVISVQEAHATSITAWDSTTLSIAGASGDKVLIMCFAQGLTGSQPVGVTDGTTTYASLGTDNPAAASIDSISSTGTTTYSGSAFGSSSVTFIQMVVIQFRP